MNVFHEFTPFSPKNHFLHIFTYVFKAYKYRLDPTRAQAELINKHIGSTRFLYNLALETKQTAYAGAKVNLSRFDLQKQIPELKLDLPWLKEINSQSLQYALVCLDTAYKNFFKNQSGFPKFKSKHGRGSFGVPQNIIVDGNRLIIPKFKEGIKIILHRPLGEGEIKQATISRTPTGKYFVSILVDNGKELPEKVRVKESTSIGVDLGLKDLVVTSEGERFENPKHLKKVMNKLKFIQSKYSKHKGKKTKKRLQLMHEKVANARKDLLHKISSKLVSENQTICLEDLSIEGMMKNHKLAGAIGDVGWGMLVEMLTYKADWMGKNVLFIGRFDPSSKMCSGCGWINRKLELSEREWACGGCGLIHDRDENAAKNIKAFAMNKKHLCVERTLKNHGELPTLVGVMTREAHRSSVGG